MSSQNYKLLLYVITNDGDDWDNPNALLIPVNSPDSKITLGRLKNIFPLPGKYHYRLSEDSLVKVKQYVDKVADLGKRNLLFRISVKHLYSIFNICKTEAEYKYSLLAVNHFYNFGRQITPETINKLFILTLRCNQINEAISMLNGYKTWLSAPPSIELIYVLLSELISRKDYTSVYKLFTIIHSSWQIPLTGRLYESCIKAMIISGVPINDVIEIYQNSRTYKIKLKLDLHSDLLEHLLENDSSFQLIKLVIKSLLYDAEGCLNGRCYYLLSWSLYKYKDELKSYLNIFGKNWLELFKYAERISERPIIISNTFKEILKNQT